MLKARQPKAESALAFPYLPIKIKHKNECFLPVYCKPGTLPARKEELI